MAEFVVVVTRPGSGESTVHHFEDAVVVGRGPEAGLRLVDPVVSRLHAEIAVDGQGWRVTDLGSSNGTRVDGVLVVDGSLAAGEGSTIAIGPFLLSFRDPLGTTVHEALPLPVSRTARLDRAARRLLIEGGVVLDPLTAHEYAFLDALDGHSSGAVTREALADAVWGAGQWDDYMLYNLVSRLRRRIADLGVAEDVLVTVPGFGYRLG
jgi:pSer/pThr/pTyr-binding forkhead associated (FHA) protein